MRVFIIDDDPFFTKILQFQLESLKKYEVHIFQSGERALGQLSLVPDVIFLDHYLKKIPGTEIIPLILTKVSECKIVSMSSQKDIKVMDQAIKNGAYKYLRKDDCFAENVIELLNEIEEPTIGSSMLEKIGELFSSSKKRSKPLIFITEDDQTFNFLISYKLDSLDEYLIETYSKGIEVMNNIDRKPDVLILDYNLENMKGSEIIEVFKQKSPETKIIVMSSQQDIDVALELLDTGADDYIVKGNDIIERVKLALQKNLNE